MMTLYYNDLLALAQSGDVTDAAQYIYHFICIKDEASDGFTKEEISKLIINLYKCYNRIVVAFKTIKNSKAIDKERTDIEEEENNIETGNDSITHDIFEARDIAQKLEKRLNNFIAEEDRLDQEDSNKLKSNGRCMLDFDDLNILQEALDRQKSNEQSR